MTLDEKENLIQQLMADIDVATAQQPSQNKVPEPRKPCGSHRGRVSGGGFCTMQQVNSMPLLQSVNRFACLAEESINVNNTSDAAPEPVEDIQIAPKPTCHQVPKWEH
jgi:hypothetical protein